MPVPLCNAALDVEVMNGKGGAEVAYLRVSVCYTEEHVSVFVSLFAFTERAGFDERIALDDKSCCPAHQAFREGFEEILEKILRAEMFI